MARTKKSDISPHDSAVAFALYVNDLLDRDGTTGDTIQWAAPFPGQLGPKETFLTQAPFQLREFTALQWRDGTSTAQSPGVAAILTGSAADAVVMGQAVGTIIASSRRRDAETPQWRVIDSGLVYISILGFYMQTARSILPWPWESIQSGELVGPGMFKFSGESTSGAVTYIIESDMAELIFTLWSRIVHPVNPQFTSGAWIPTGWADHMEAAGLTIQRLTRRWSSIAPSTTKTLPR